MRQHRDNPARNIIPAGMKEAALVCGIERSGYPLQGLAAATLKRFIGVTEEWSYVDDETEKSRSLDLYGYQKFAHEGLVATGLALLVECKRSPHPLVFFQQVLGREAPQFPAVAGLWSQELPIWEAKSERQCTVNVSRALQLETLPFIASGPPPCRSFARAEPKGSDDVILTGRDPYAEIIIPLVKGLRHELARTSHPLPGETIWPTLALCIGVVDSPMVLVERPEKVGDPVLTPWVRVLRHEAAKNKRGPSIDRYYGIDVVHIDFLERFMEEYAMPFALEFSRRAEKSEVLFRGQAESLSLDRIVWNELWARQG